MTNSGSWTTVTFSSDTPPLLIKTRLNRTGYDIQLTDLSRIWAETLSKTQIIKRANDSGCSFNPGDDDGNYDTFLKCIKSALDRDAKTTSNLRTGEPGKLFLDLSTPLPGDLLALAWTIELAQQPNTAVANEIVGPLLLQANSLQSQIHQLVEELSAKDHVIQKITDKFDGGQFDLTTVFPGVSNVKTSRRKGSQRTQLAGHVKGLAGFDEAVWRTSNEKLREGQQLTPDVMNTALQDLPLPDRDEQINSDWVQNLSDSRKRSKGASQVHARPKSKSGDAAASKPATQDDFFERKATPPHLSKHGVTEKDSVTRESVPQAGQPAQTGEDSETDDEDCLDIPATTSQQQAVSTIEPNDDDEDDVPSKRRYNAASANSHRPGVINGEKTEPAQPDLDGDEAPASSPPITKSQVKPEADETESEAEPELVPEPEKPRKVALGKFGGAKPKDVPKTATVQDEEPEQLPAKPRATLGRFGAKKVHTSTPAPEPTGSAPSASKPKATLGRFGGRAKNAAANQSSEQTGKQDVEVDSSAHNGSAKTSLTPSRRLEPEVRKEPERELTEEEKLERANEKREQLKRELEEKANRPVKKKRKF